MAHGQSGRLNSDPHQVVGRAQWASVDAGGILKEGVLILVKGVIYVSDDKLFHRCLFRDPGGVARGGMQAAGCVGVGRRRL